MNFENIILLLCEQFITHAEQLLSDPKLLGYELDKEINGTDLYNRLQNYIPPRELQIYKKNGLKRFLRIPRTPNDLKDWILQNKVNLEVKEIYASEEDAKLLSDSSRKANELLHWFETQKIDPKIALDYSQHSGEGFYDNWTPEFREKAIEYQNAVAIASGEISPTESAIIRWPHLNPKPLSQMPGAVDLLVTIPIKLSTRYSELLDLANKRPLNTTETKELKKYNKTGLRYTSDHYPQSGQNLVVHIRGYMENVPEKDTVKVYRGVPKGTDDSILKATAHPGNQFSTDRETAQEYARQHDGEVKEYNIPRSFLQEDTIYKGDYRLLKDYKPRKGFRVFEVQSDWGEVQRKDIESFQTKIKELKYKLKNHYVQRDKSPETLSPAEIRNRVNKMYNYWWEHKRREIVNDIKILERAINSIKKEEPILHDYNRLAIKTAIEYAKKNNAEAIIIDDAETAMLNEQHDQKAVTRYNEMENINEIFPMLQKQFEEKYPTFANMYDLTMLSGDYGRWERATTPLALVEKVSGLVKYYLKPTIDNRFINKFLDFGLESPIPFKWVEYREPLKQEKGMRLNYDVILPRIATELTGSKGIKVEMGEHQNTKLRSDLYFQNPDGTFKTTSTGLMFSLKNVSKSFTLFGTDKVKIMPLVENFKQYFEQKINL